MPKSYTDLWSQIICWENLVLAYTKCRRRKRFKKPAIEFDFEWESNLIRLQNELASETWEPGEYHNFPISDPKPRLISAAPFRDRIVHHAIVNVLEPLFDRKFIFDSYACRKGKGTHRAIHRAQHYMRRYDWYLKTDIVQFFPNVDHEILMNQLSRTVADSRVDQLIRKVIESGLQIPSDSRVIHWYPGDDLLTPLRPCGLPIGNLTSQFFANVYLDPIDHFVKEVMRTPGYIRYADDLLLFGNTKEELWAASERLSQRLSNIRLRLHPNKTHVGKSYKGVKFLGFRVYPNQCRLTQTSLKRFRTRVRRWKWLARQGRFDHKSVRASLEAWFAHASHANTTGLRRDLMKSVRISFARNENRAKR